jgi:hypothetical protein
MPELLCRQGIAAFHGSTNQEQYGIGGALSPPENRCRSRIAHRESVV